MTDTTADNSKPEPRPFSTFLLEQAKGKTHTELSEGLQALVEKVRDTGKKGDRKSVV